MRRQAFDVRVWLSIAGVGLWLLVGCDALDPVKTESLCDRKLVSMRCPQCQDPPPYAAECSVCAGPAKSDPSMCKSETTMNPGTNGGRGGNDNPNVAGEGGSGGGAESGSGGESNGSSGTGGKSEAGAGSGGMSGPMGGAGANAPPDGLCASDTDCRFRDPSKPGCELQNKVCVQCTLDQHCSGDFKVCNLAMHRCANCASDRDCGTKKCDTANMVCVECEQDPDCNTDPVLNQCETRGHQCVDCMTNAGCEDPVNGTCETGTHSCVDCLGDGDCNEPGKPACDKASRTCVSCLIDGNCNDRVLGTCDTDARTCVDCLDDNGCEAPNPRCDMGMKTCVQCLEGTDCASGHCIGQQCVECEEDDDCLDPTKSHCNASTHVCEGCSSQSQCEHLPATKACDIQNRKCVQCIDDTTCAGKACIRAQHTCSNVGVNTVDVCLPCQADSMCKTNSKCVGLSWQGTTYGNYCVFTRQSRSGGTCANARPYTQSLSARTIDSATSSSFCIPISTTSCPGVLDVARGASGKTCTMNNQCGLGMTDAICSDGKCTYGCTPEVDVDCPDGLSCLPNAICG